MMEKSTMLRQIESVPELMRTVYGQLEQQSRIALSHSEIFALRTIRLTGCGDSLCAAMAVEQAFRQLTGLHVEVMDTMKMSRLLSSKELVGQAMDVCNVGISVSGAVTRVAEALTRVRQHGGMALGVTGNPQSDVAKAATHLLAVSIPPFHFAPGVRSYCAVVMSLLLLAVRIGEVRGTIAMQQADGIRAEIQSIPDKLEMMLPNMSKSCEVLASSMLTATSYEFIGSGSEYATAFFGCAKILETLGVHTSCIDTEDWFHMNFFVKALQDMPTCLICHSGYPTATRDEELIKTTSAMGRKVWIVTDRSELEEAGYTVIRTPELKYPYLHILTQYLPLAYIASNLCDALGEDYMRGCKGPWAAGENCALIAGGPMQIVE